LNGFFFDAREALFASMRKQRHQFNTQGVIRFGRPEDLYEAINTRVFQDYSDMDNVRFRELSKKQHVASSLQLDVRIEYKNCQIILAASSGAIPSSKVSRGRR
jgi:hypothetical protein